MIKKIKKNALVIFLGTISAIYFCILLVNRIVPSEWEKDCFNYIIWIYFFVSFVSWLNCYDLNTNRKKTCIFDLIVQLSIFITINFLLTCSVQPIYLYFIYMIVIFLILLEVVLHIFLPLKNEKEKVKQNELQENEIYRVILNGLLSGFSIRGSRSDNQLKHRVQISVVNAFSLLMIILAYVFKYVLDIINMWKDVYSFPMSIVLLYILLMLVFVSLEIVKSKLLKHSLFKTILIIVSCIIGVYMFVFMQFGHVRFRILTCSMYMVSPYLFRFFDVVKSIQLEEHKV